MSAAAERGPARRTSVRLRWIAAVALAVLAAVGALGAVASRFVHADLLDTDHYVAAVSPLASDPAVQQTVATAVTDALMDQFDVAGLTQNGLDGLASVIPGLPSQWTGTLGPAIVQRVRSYVLSATTAFVHSDQFPGVWSQANRVAHANLVAVLTGDGSAATTADADGSVRLQLAPIAEAVANRLSANGLALADDLPRVEGSIVLFRSAAVPRLQGATRLLDRGGAWLPWIAAVLAAASIALAPRGRRRRAATDVALAVGAAMALLVVAVVIGRAWYLAALPADVLPRDGASDLFGALIAPLLTRAYVLGGVALAVAAALIVLGRLRPRWFGESADPDPELTPDHTLAEAAA